MAVHTLQAAIRARRELADAPLLSGVLPSLGVSLASETRRLVYVGTGGDETTYDPAASKKEAPLAVSVVRT